MPRFAANISMLYPELDFLDRFAAAAADGFEAVEYQFAYELEPEQISTRLRDSGAQLVLFNAPSGDSQVGDRGLACLPGRQAEFRASIDTALRYAEVIGCPRIHVMAGLLPAGESRESLHALYVERLQWAAVRAAEQGVDVLIEPINTRDIPGYFLNRQDRAHQVVHDAGMANLKVQMDLYHCQIVEGDVSMKIERYLPTGSVGHMQIAGVPERHEPDVGELNYGYLFATLDRIGYGGWIGCEYRPRAGVAPGGTSAGLGWLRPYLSRR